MYPAKANTLAKSNRLTRSSQLYYVLNQGKKVNNKWLTLSFVEKDSRDGNASKSCDINKLGIIIKKKTFKKTVERNKFKRIVREYFRTHKGLFKNYFDIVICIHKTPDRLEKKYYNSVIAALFKKGKLIC